VSTRTITVYEELATWEQLNEMEADRNGIQLHLHGIVQLLFPSLDEAMAAFNEHEQPV
jgi:hypothetical protein